MGDRAKLESELDYIYDLPGFERSSPQYFANPMIDKLLEIVMLQSAEMWALRDRQLVTEHLLSTKGKVTTTMIEEFKPDEEFRSSLQTLRDQSVKRVFGSLYDVGQEPSDSAATKDAG